MSASRLLVAIFAVAGLCATAQAQSTRDRLTMLESNVARLERLLENNQVMQTQLLQRLNELQTENQALRDAVERLQFESEQAGGRQRQLYMDLDQRLQALEGRSAPLPAGDTVGAPAAAAAATGAGTAPALSDAAAYQAAFDLLKDGAYKEANAAFTAFLADYPTSDLRGNAQYWLAETLYVATEFERALAGFQTVITDYPTTRKVPDAWLKTGYCNYELKRWSDARLSLETVANRYPDSTAAKLAAQRLAQMRSEGR